MFRESLELWASANKSVADAGKMELARQSGQIVFTGFYHFVISHHDAIRRTFQRRYRNTARSTTTQEIVRHIGDLYGTAISPDLVSRVTASVLEDGAAK